MHIENINQRFFLKRKIEERKEGKKTKKVEVLRQSSCVPLGKILIVETLMEKEILQFSKEHKGRILSQRKKVVRSDVACSHQDKRNTRQREAPLMFCT